MAARLLLAALLLLLLVSLDTMALAVDEDFYTCVPGIKPNIGVSTPKGDTFVEKGSDPFFLYCHLNPDYKLEGELDSTMLSFQMSASGEGGEIFLETREVVSEIVDNQTIRHRFNPDTYGVFNVDCRREKKLMGNISGIDTVERDGVIYGKLGFCPQRIFVGYPPRDVENFSCISENWDNLNCTWDEPWNPIPTKYRLTFKSGSSRFAPQVPCPDKRELERQMMRELPNELNMCYVDLSTHPPYRQTASILSFFFNATNKLQPTGYQQMFSVPHYEVVRPGPPENLEAEASTENSLQLTFEIPRTLIHFPAGLIFAVRYRSNWSMDWSSWTSKDVKNMEKETYSLENLSYSWTKYEIQVRLLSGMANASDARYWSQPASAEQKTLASIPPSPPRIHPGSFEIIGGINDRTVVVFWQKLDEKLHNGENFRYTVTDVRQEGHSEPLLPVTTTSTFMEFQKVGLGQQSIFITSENSMGQAPTSAKIVVPAARELRNIQPKSFTRTLYPEDNVYEVAWLPPKDKEQIVSYTVFWCKYERDRPHYCEGFLDWEEVPIGDSSLETVIHNITLPDGGNYQMAIAANTNTHSSGLVWATCTIIKNRVVGKLKEVSVDGIGETTALVRWRLDCQDRIGIVTGYEIVYCSIRDEMDVDQICAGRNLTQEIPRPDADKANLTNLTPWTPYKIMVRVITRGGVGELSDPLVKRTNPAAPGSPPMYLEVTAQANSANFSWRPPTQPNGNIDSYKVNIEEEFHNIWRQIGSGASKVAGDSTQMSWRQSKLKAFTDYRVTVAACNNLLLDQHSQHLACGPNVLRSFRTDVGRPGKPNEPVVTFKNSSIVELKWDKEFQLGAAEPLRWDIMIRRVGNQWKSNPKTAIIQVAGSASSHTMDLRRIQDREDWSPDCENLTASVTSNRFNFTMRAVVANPGGDIFVGGWSRPITLPAVCQNPPPWGAIITAVVLTTVGAALLFIILYKFSCHCNDMWERHKDMANLDKLPVYPLEEIKGGMNKDYSDPLARDHMGGGGGGGGGGHRRDHSKDSLQNLLKETQDLGRGSDTTSGCESGHSSELGDRELGAREGEELEEEVGPLLPDYMAAPPTWLGPDSPGYSHCVEAPPTSYTQVGSLQDTPGYVNQLPTPSNYSSPPPVPTPVTLNPTAPPLQAGYSTVVTSSMLASPTCPAGPSQGYVTFNSVKSTAAEAPSPGYITLSQLSPSKEGPESKESGSLSPSSLPPGYSRVGLNATSPGYVAWTSTQPSPPDAGEKQPVTSFEPPRQLDKEEDRDMSLVITPRALGLRESMDSTGIASMV